MSTDAGPAAGGRVAAAAGIFARTAAWIAVAGVCSRIAFEILVFCWNATGTVLQVIAAVADILWGP